MPSSAQFLNAGEAAARLGVSAKALRLYERRGLVHPLRTDAGWRTYGPDEMSRAAEIVALRKLGFSLAEVTRALAGGSRGLEPALAAHQTTLEERRRDLVGMIEKIGALRAGLARGETAAVGGMLRVVTSKSKPAVTFELPWPWGEEVFELRRLRPLTYITGPLGSGKTRFARRLAEALPDACFLGLDRLAEDGALARCRLEADPALQLRVDRTLARLIAEGATQSMALTALLVELEAEQPSVLVVDMVEHGLDQASQEALTMHLRRHAICDRPLFLLTRSCAILDLSAVGPDESILFCPANHSPPIYVTPYPGTPGYDAVATCLASPKVRARTDGVIAWRQRVT